MVDRQTLIRLMAHAAKESSSQSGQFNLKETLLAIVKGKYSAELQEGKTLISTSELGGAATFALNGELTPVQVAALAYDTVCWLRTCADPENPTDDELFPPLHTTERLRASFKKAVL